MLFELLLPYLLFSWDSLDFLSPFGRTIISASLRARRFSLRVLLIVLLGADVPNVLTQGLVLALTLEGELIQRHLVWICQTHVHHSCHSSELSLVIFLRLRVLGRALAVRLGVVEFTCLAVCKADLVAFRHLAVDHLHRECIFYVCHNVLGNRTESKKTKGICFLTTMVTMFRGNQLSAALEGGGSI